MSTITGGQAVVQTLKAEGVETVFGIISVHMLPIYDALREEPGIRLIVPRHEQAAGFMADAYARVSGKVGVYLTSTGPGAANSAGAVLEAVTSSTRTLQLTGQIESAYLDQGRGFLHEIADQPGMFRALGARAERITTTEDAPAVLHTAFRALRAQPGPVVVEMPIDQQYRKAEVTLGRPLPAPLPLPDPGDLDRAADLLAGARRPLLWLGGGANTAQAHDEARQVAEALGAAVVTTRGGRGILPDDHPLVVGSYPQEPVGRAFIEQADAVLAVGTRFSGTATDTWQLRLPSALVRVDLTPQRAQANYPPAVALVGDARRVLAELARRLAERDTHADAAYRGEIAALRETCRAAIRERAPRNAALMDTIRAVTPRDTIFVTDSTLPAYTGANQYLPVYAERGFVNPRSVAIGPGLPFALGAKAAAPGQPVVCIAGDGGFMLNLGELATAVQEQLNVVVCLFNNQGYGILRRYQRHRFEGRFIGVDLHTPDFVALAEACGLWAERVTRPEMLGPALERALTADCPALLDIQAPFE